MNRLSLFVLILLVSVVAEAHPGQLAKDGCHRCKKNCAPSGKDGERHCHEELKVAPNPPSLVAHVTKVVDGDTLHVVSVDLKKKHTVRILGIDCPESRANQKCKQGGDCKTEVVLGKKAKKRAVKLLESQTVLLTTWRAKFEKDRNKRMLAYVHLESGADVGEILVKEKLCRDYGDRYPHPRSGSYRGL